MESSNQPILDLTAHRGLIRQRDLNERELPTVSLTRLEHQGLLQKIERGLNAVPDRPVLEHVTLTKLDSKHSQAIICVQSALTLHELIAQFDVQSLACFSQLDPLVKGGLPSTMHLPFLWCRTDIGDRGTRHRLRYGERVQIRSLGGRILKVPQEDLP